MISSGIILVYSLKPYFRPCRSFFTLHFSCEDFFCVEEADKIFFIMNAFTVLYFCALGKWHREAMELPLIISSLTLIWNFHDGDRDVRERDMNV